VKQFAILQALQPKDQFISTQMIHEYTKNVMEG